MWRPKKTKLIILDILASVLGLQNQNFRGQYIWHHCLNFFIAGFPYFKFNFKVFILVINVIDCKTKEAIKAYLFAPFIASKSMTTSNIIMFEDLNIT